MGKLLYCKNKPCYDIENNQVLDSKLVPYYILKDSSITRFNQWIKLRYSTGSNTFARMLRGITFGQGNRQLINEKTFMLSYSDCYWVKDENNTIRFEDVSPYYTSFWTGKSEYQGGAVPTLYTPGYLSKEWRESGKLFKAGDLEIEIDCINLCKECGVFVENGRVVDGGIELDNFTSADVMLVTAESSGKIDGENFTDEDVIREFGIEAVRMFAIDAIIGNGDRHAGNFGFLQDANTGEVLGMSPLFDFDHALDDSKEEVSGYLLSTLMNLNNTEYIDEVLRITNKASNFSRTIFSKRAQNLKDKILNRYKKPDVVNHFEG